MNDKLENKTQENKDVLEIEQENEEELILENSEDSKLLEERGKTDNTILLKSAFETLKKYWFLIMLGFIVYFILSSIPDFLSSFLIKKNLYPGIFFRILYFFLEGPFVLGLSAFFLSVSRGEKPNLKLLFLGFKRKNFFKSMGLYLLTSLFILLWSLLLIIPGIIESYSYSMTYFVMLEDDSLSIMDIIKRSEDIMEGFKFKLFLLDLIFLGFMLLSIFTLGLALIFIIPLWSIAKAKFYDDIKFNSSQNNVFEETDISKTASV